MKTMAKAALVLLALGLFVVPVQGQNLNGEPLGDLYISFSNSEYVGSNDFSTDPVLPFSPFTFFAVIELDYADIGFPNSGGMNAWEATISIPTEVTVSQAQYDGVLDLGDGPLNWIVGIGRIVPALNTPFVAVTYSCIFLIDPVPTNVQVTVSASVPSSNEIDLPLFNEGQDFTGECFRQDGSPQGCIRPFATVRGLVINEAVAVESDSWSSVKSRF